MIHRFAALTVAGFGLIFIAANPTEVPPTSTASSSLTSPSNLASTPVEKLSLSIDHTEASGTLNLGFEATETEAYYLIEGRTELDKGDWSLGYGIKGHGKAQSTEMPAQSRTGFYRMQRVQEDSPLLQKDYDGDKVVALDELKRGLNAFDPSNQPFDLADFV
jgi:hypothetical protein